MPVHHRDADDHRPARAPCPEHRGRARLGADEVAATKRVLGFDPGRASQADDDVAMPFVSAAIENSRMPKWIVRPYGSAPRAGALRQERAVKLPETWTGTRCGRSTRTPGRAARRTPPFDCTATEELGQNAIVIRVRPDEGVTVRFSSKVPGTSMEIRDVTMDFAYGESFTESSPEAYERLILDVLLGDANLFPRHQEVAESWRILDPIEEHRADNGRPARYAAGGWGPGEADEMLARDGRSWRRP